MTSLILECFSLREGCRQAHRCGLDPWMGRQFYSPTYVAISRSLAKRGYTVITGNTRMHDLGNVEAWRGEKRIRGVAIGSRSEQVRDLAAWIDFAEGLGSSRSSSLVTAPARQPFVLIKRKHKTPALRRGACVRRHPS